MLDEIKHLSIFQNTRTLHTDTANQAQSKRAAAPHMFRESVAGEKVADVTALEDQVSTGIFLAGKAKVCFLNMK